MFSSGLIRGTNFTWFPVKAPRSLGTHLKTQKHRLNFSRSGRTMKGQAFCQNDPGHRWSHLDWSDFVEKLNCLRFELHTFKGGRRHRSAQRVRLHNLRWESAPQMLSDFPSTANTGGRTTDCHLAALKVVRSWFQFIFESLASFGRLLEVLWLAISTRSGPHTP